MSDVALHTVVSGVPGGATVVLGPSLGTRLSVWDAQLAVLEPAFRVVRYDLRGHDRSDVRPGPYALRELGGDVVRVLDSLQVSRAHYVGLSLGGMVGMWLAVHVPERIDRLTLVSTSAFMPPASTWLDRAGTVRAKGTGAVAETVVGRWFTPTFRELHADVVARYTQQLADVPAEGYAGCCEAIAAMDLRPDLAAVRAPTLVVVGTDDLATPLKHAHEIAGRIQGARVEQVAGAAHLANVEQPDVIGRLIVEHLGAP